MMHAIYSPLNAFLAIFVLMVVVGLMLWVRNKSLRSNSPGGPPAIAMT